MAILTASVRVRAKSLDKMDVIWNFTVLSEIKSVSAICLLVKPFFTKANNSNSLLVNGVDGKWIGLEAIFVFSIPIDSSNMCEACLFKVAVSCNAAVTFRWASFKSPSSINVFASTRKVLR